MLPLLLASFVFSAGCSLVWSAKIPVDVPPAPQVLVCPEEPVVDGDLRGDEVVLSLADAKKLRDWISQYKVCMGTNVAVLQGYAEKLVNRLNALKGN